ncbi:DUF4376 domain-containing protein [Halomonas sp. RA08-2]|uniref:DUF4376 domain-containing protein n=1 Tax=Halomonas sp. RA08-2 TaxID=3440842 RepID=UPI003EEB4936
MWARIENGTVTEITDIDPTGRFHPSIQWVACSTDTRPGWHYDGEQCLPPPPELLEDLAVRKRAEIDQVRDTAFAAGLPYEIAGEPDVVQTRPQDQINLLGLSAKAQRLIAAGDSEATLTFRGLSNVNRELTAEEMDALALAALAHIESIYQRSWMLKDAITTAVEQNTRDDLKGITWKSFNNRMLHE